MSEGSPISDLAIEVEGLGKMYLIRHQTKNQYVALRDVLSDGMRSLGRRAARPILGGTAAPPPSQETFWALQDVSVAVGRGERLGIIGRNGAGKSTLLKILSRITEPTAGRVRLRGRVASLLEVGTGFHPELTGRENVYLNGTILGMSRQEVRRKFDEIVAFAEVERFLDTPVKRYSSGMYVRLAFAVAAHLEPEILLVDEVLAIGDAAFQRKCLGKMGDVAQSGRTIVLVSHNMAAIEQLSSQCIWLDRGRLRQAGTPREVIDAYNASFSTPTDGSFEGTVMRGDRSVELLSYSVTRADGDSRTVPVTNDDITITVRLCASRDIAYPACGLAIRNGYGVLVTSLNSVQNGQTLAGWTTGEHTITVRLQRVPYLPGSYRADFWVMGPAGGDEIFAHVEDAIAFEIAPSPIYGMSYIASAGWGTTYTEMDFATDGILSAPTLG